MWLVVAVVGLPSAWRNPTAAALVLSYVFAEALYFFTGNGLATQYFTFPDIFCLTVIACKPAYYPREYQGIWEQIKCGFLGRSPADRFIMCSFPFGWYLYVCDWNPYYVYWGLYWLAIAQFLAAGAEGFATHINRRKAAASDQLSEDVFRFSWVRGYG